MSRSFCKLKWRIVPAESIPDHLNRARLALLGLLDEVEILHHDLDRRALVAALVVPRSLLQPSLDGYALPLLDVLRDYLSGLSPRDTVEKARRLLLRAVLSVSVR